MAEIQILTIDGPSGSGKGTVATRIAETLGWHLLDSGALYRLVGYAAQKAGLDLSDVSAVTEVARHLKVDFSDRKIWLDGEDVSLLIRTETAGNNASRVAAIPAVREALLDWQRHYARLPGLVADGRDMGTVVFPQAKAKIFLDASAEERAGRRYKQLKDKGIDVNLSGLIAEIEERDDRDRNRSVAPLVPAKDAQVIDSTKMSVEEVVDSVLQTLGQAYPENGV
jgi:cytidylate kinase